MNWIKEVEGRLEAKPEHKHHPQDRADIRRALRIIKRLREALEDACSRVEAEYCSHKEPCKANYEPCYGSEYRAALEYEGEG